MIKINRLILLIFFALPISVISQNSFMPVMTYTNYYESTDYDSFEYNYNWENYIYPAPKSLRLESNPFCEGYVDESWSGYLNIALKYGDEYKYGLPNPLNELNVNINYKIRFKNGNFTCKTISNSINLEILDSKSTSSQLHQIYIDDLSNIGGCEINEFEFEITNVVFTKKSGIYLSNINDLKFEFSYDLKKKYQARIPTTYPNPEQPVISVDYDQNNNSVIDIGEEKYDYINEEIENDFRAVKLEWQTDCEEFEFDRYQVQILKLNNTKYSKSQVDDKPYKVKTDVDWEKALSIIVTDSQKYLDVFLGQGTGYYTWRVRPIGNYHPNDLANNSNYGLWNTESIIDGTEFDSENLTNSSFHLFYQNKHGIDSVSWSQIKVISEDNNFGTNLVDAVTYYDNMSNPVQEVINDNEHSKDINDDKLLEGEGNVILQSSYPDYHNRLTMNALPIPVNDDIDWTDNHSNNPDIKPENGSSLKFRLGVATTETLIPIYEDGDYLGDENLPHEFSRANFDKSHPNTNNNKVIYSDPTDQYLGYLDKYYDGNGNEQLNKESGVPQANSYAYGKVILENDGTGRTKTIVNPGSYSHNSPFSRVGIYYAGCTEKELVAMFGIEAPEPNKAYKVITRDENNVYNISYFNHLGQNIASGILEISGNYSSLSELDKKSNKYYKFNSSSSSEVQPKQVTINNPKSYLLEYENFSFSQSLEDLDVGFTSKKILFNHCSWDGSGFTPKLFSPNIDYDIDIKYINHNNYYGTPINYDFDATTNSLNTRTNNLPSNLLTADPESSAEPATVTLNIEINFDSDDIKSVINSYKNEIEGDLADYLLNEFNYLQEIKDQIDNYSISGFYGNLDGSNGTNPNDSPNNKNWGWTAPTTSEENYTKSLLICGTEYLLNIPPSLCDDNEKSICEAEFDEIDFEDKIIQSLGHYNITFEDLTEQNSTNPIFVELGDAMELYFWRETASTKLNRTDLVNNMFNDGELLCKDEIELNDPEPLLTGNYTLQSPYSVHPYSEIFTTLLRNMRNETYDSGDLKVGNVNNDSELSFLSNNNQNPSAGDPVWTENDLCGCWDVAIASFEIEALIPYSDYINNLEGNDPESEIYKSNIEFYSGKYYLNRNFDLLGEFLECTGTKFEGFSNQELFIEGYSYAANDDTEIEVGDPLPTGFNPANHILGGGYVTKAYKYLPASWIANLYQNNGLYKTSNNSTNINYNINKDFDKPLLELYSYIDPNSPALEANTEVLSNKILAKEFPKVFEGIYNYTLGKSDPYYCQNDFNDISGGGGGEPDFDNITDYLDRLPGGSKMSEAEFKEWENSLGDNKKLFTDLYEKSEDSDGNVYYKPKEPVKAMSSMLATLSTKCHGRAQNIEELKVRLKQAYYDSPKAYVFSEDDIYVTSSDNYYHIIWNSARTEIQKLRLYTEDTEHLPSYFGIEPIFISESKLAELARNVSLKLKSDCDEAATKCSEELAESIGYSNQGDVNPIDYMDQKLKNASKLNSAVSPEEKTLNERINCLSLSIAEIKSILDSKIQFRIPEDDFDGNPVGCGGELLSGYDSGNWRTVNVTKFVNNYGEIIHIPFGSKREYIDKLSKALNNTLSLAQDHAEKNLQPYPSLSFYENKRYKLLQYADYRLRFNACERFQETFSDYSFPQNDGSLLLDLNYYFSCSRDIIYESVPFDDGIKSYPQTLDLDYYNHLNFLHTRINNLVGHLKTNDQIYRLYLSSFQNEEYDLNELVFSKQLISNLMFSVPQLSVHTQQFAWSNLYLYDSYNQINKLNHQKNQIFFVTPKPTESFCFEIYQPELSNPGNSLNNSFYCDDFTIEDFIHVDESTNLIYYMRAVRNLDAIMENQYWETNSFISDPALENTFFEGENIEHYKYLELFNFQLTNDFSFAAPPVPNKVQRIKGGSNNIFFITGIMGKVPDFPDQESFPEICYRYIQNNFDNISDMIEKDEIIQPKGCEDFSFEQITSALLIQTSSIANNLKSSFAEKLDESLKIFVLGESDKVNPAIPDINFTNGGGGGYSNHGTPLVDVTSKIASAKINQITLAYYDEMGQLLKTVPPEGVDIDDNHTRASLPGHKMVTYYRHNSLGQLIETKTPDSGPDEMNTYKDVIVNGQTYKYAGGTIYFYDDLGRLRFSVNAKQMHNYVTSSCPPDADPPNPETNFAPLVSYIKYDQWSRVIESGEFQSYYPPNLANYNGEPTLAMLIESYLKTKQIEYMNMSPDPQVHPYDSEIHKYYEQMLYTSKRFFSAEPDFPEFSSVHTEIVPHPVCELTEINGSSMIGMSPITQNDIDISIYRKIGLSTRIHYDEQANAPPKASFVVENTKNRVAQMRRYRNRHKRSTDYTESYFKYDIHGNLISFLNYTHPDGNSFSNSRPMHFQTDYEIDYGSGLLHRIDYQMGLRDQMSQILEYDKNNRLKALKTTRDDAIIETDATYHYYELGNLKRKEIGTDKLQGVDYYYTLQGQLAGINDVNMNMRGDGYDAFGGDAYTGAGDNPGRGNFAQDIFAESVIYNTSEMPNPKQGYGGGFYSVAPFSSLPQQFQPDELYDGTIAATDNIYNDDYFNQTGGLNGDIERYQNVFKYDQAYRLKSSRLNPRSVMGAVSMGNNFKAEFNYDHNGNILDVDRTSDNGALRSIDNTTTNLPAVGPGGASQVLNRLNVATFSDLPSAITYKYDELGQLITEAGAPLEEGTPKINSITWTADGKVDKLNRSFIIIDDYEQEVIINIDIHYYYDPMGNLVLKLKEFSPNIYPLLADYNLHCEDNYKKFNLGSEYFGYDATNTLLATYDHLFLSEAWGCFPRGPDINLREWYGYGLGKESTTRPKTELTVASLYTQHPVANPWDMVYDENMNLVTGLQIRTVDRDLGFKDYEVLDHIGNVRAVFNDIKIPSNISNASGPFSVYLKNLSSYYPYGDILPSGDWTRTNYKSNILGFQSMFAEDDLLGKGKVYNTMFRKLSTDNPRWWSTDPLASLQPNLSPYSSMGGNPINRVDPFGLIDDDVEHDGTRGSSGKTSKTVVERDGKTYEQSNPLKPGKLIENPPPANDGSTIRQTPDKTGLSGLGQSWFNFNQEYQDYSGYSDPIGSAFYFGSQITYSTIDNVGVFSQKMFGVENVTDFKGDVLSSGDATKKAIDGFIEISLAGSGKLLKSISKLDEVIDVGEWITTKESMSSAASSYQNKVTGMASNKSYLVNNVKFDGIKLDGTLLDAKSGMGNFVNKNGDFYNWFNGEKGLRNQARRQLKAANGKKIEWHFQNEKVMKATQKLFINNNISGINLIYSP